MKAIALAACLAFFAADEPAMLRVLDDSAAPLQLDHVEVVRNANGTPAIVRVDCHNRLPVPVTRAFIDALVFNDLGRLRLQSSGVISRPLPASAAGTVTIPVNNLDAKPDWRVVVAVQRADYGDGRWIAADLRQKAEAAITSTARPTTTDAAPDESVWDGIYTNEQAARGEQSYGQHCARCHGADLQAMVPEQVAKEDELIARGTMHHRTPALVGPDFTGHWNGLSVGDLFDRVRISMPQETPGSLSNAQVSDVLAFMLQQNGFPGGSTDMPAKSEPLGRVKFTSAR